MALDFMAGCVGGAAGIIVGHPLDTVKVRIQTQCPINPKYRGTYHCLSSIVKKESIGGLYKGIASPLYGVASINAVIFGVYGLLKPMVSGQPGNDALWAHFAAGAAAGSVQSVIASPMELVKTRMQLDESVTAKGKGASAWDVLKNVYLKEGGMRRGVFKGWCVTLSREIPGLGAYFATYEALTRGGREITTIEMMMAGGMAGIMSWVTCFPMDVIKTRIQSDVTGKYTGAIDCLQKTISGEGYRALFRGLNSTLIRAFPTNAATFTAVTWVMRLASQEQDEGKVNNLEALLEQWDEGRVLVQEKIAQSLQLTIPQYNSFLTTATPTSGTVLASPLEAYKQFFQEHQNIFQNQSQSQSQSQTNLNANVASAEETAPGNEISDLREIPSRVSTPAALRIDANRPFLSSSISRAEVEFEATAQIIAASVTPAVGVSSDEGTRKRKISVAVNSSMQQKSTMTEETSTPSSPIRGNLNSNTNSHETGSFPPDLGVLAEILDLPLIVLQNSLDGNLTLFNIILTWLKQGTRFSLCKCLDALDQCVCYNR